MEENRQKVIHDKGFNLGKIAEYNGIKIGPKELEDAVLSLGVFNKTKNNLKMGKGDIIKALIDMDLPRLREISNYFYNTNGLYRNMCHYFAFMYRYDWYVGPEIIDNKNLNEEKIIKDFYKLLSYFDNSELKRLSGEIALKVIKDGAYYAYIIPSAERLILQELPVKYCRVRYNVGLDPAVEFNMRFFDDYFSNPAYRIKVLKLFPKEFAKGYALYK